ncbi:MAG: SIS domain-containing protein [Endomicrobium sp.]|jgi:D-sedoheptulose 7-phosphate isomerase|nr:SIS domain-containing protein [Endomicrobium sp.]
MTTKELIKSLISDSIEVKKEMLNPKQIEYIYNVANKIVETYKNDKKTIICGNGGSAADALHFATEIVVRFEKNRKAAASIALSGNVATITAIGNDLGYEFIFSRQLEAFAKNGDVFIAISTSGNSLNIIKALKVAKKLGIFKIGMTNSEGGKMKDMCDLCYCAPTKITARAQECHILLMHIIAKIIEEKNFN